MNDWTEATYEKFVAAKNHLQTFDKSMTFESLSESRLNEYVLFLRNRKDLRNSTIGKQIGFVKWFLRWAHHKGYNRNTTFEIFRPKLKQARKTVVFLSEEELTQIKAFSIPPHKSYLDRVRDVFLFCCFTGIRYSDVYNLKRSDVKGGHIEIVTVKTVDTLIIELNDHSKAILQKYADIAFENDKALPVVSNQKMNDYIKELCEIAGIDEQVTLIHFKGNERIETIAPKHTLVGTHTGRRTFICNALALGIPVQVVMKWTGHSDFKSMKPYIDVADKIRAGEMERFNGFGKLS
jgi:integrase